MSVTVYAIGNQVKAFRQVIQALDALRYHAKLRVYPNGDNGFMANSQNKVQAGFFGWITSDATAANLLGTWRCAAFKRNGRGNVNPAKYCDPAFDRLLDRARRAESTSIATATALWARADHLLVDQAPWIPLVNPSWVDLVSRRVRNFECSPVLGMLFDQMRLR